MCCSPYPYLLYPFVPPTLTISFNSRLVWLDLEVFACVYVTRWRLLFNGASNVFDNMTKQGFLAPLTEHMELLLYLVFL